MSHELHLSKLMKKLIFSRFHVHHPQYLAGNSLQSKWLLGPHLNTLAVRRLVRNAAAPVVRCLPPGSSWCACADLHGAIGWCLGGLHGWLLAWLESALTSLVFACWKMKFFVLWCIAYLSCQVLVEMPAILNLYIHSIYPKPCSVGSYSRAVVCSALLSRPNLPRFSTERLTEAVLCRCSPAQLPSKCLAHHVGAWSRVWFQPVSWAEGVKAFGHGTSWRIFSLLSTCNMYIPPSRMLDTESLLSESHFSWQHWFWHSAFAVLPESSCTLNLLTTQALCSGSVSYFQ